MDEDLPKKPATYTIGQDLALLSIEEIEETIGELKLEIERLEKAGHEKSGHMSAAEALFKQ